MLRMISSRKAASTLPNPSPGRLPISDAPKVQIHRVFIPQLHEAADRLRGGLTNLGYQSVRWQRRLTQLFVSAPESPSQVSDTAEPLVNFNAKYSCPSKRFLAHNECGVVGDR